MIINLIVPKEEMQRNFNVKRKGQNQEKLEDDLSQIWKKKKSKRVHKVNSQVVLFIVSLNVKIRTFIQDTFDIFTMNLSTSKKHNNKQDNFVNCSKELRCDDCTGNVFLH